MSELEICYDFSECRVEFDYVAQEQDELSIKKGDIIKNVVTKMDGWYEGTLNGKTGKRRVTVTLTTFILC